MSFFFKNFGPYSKLRTANRPITWRKQTQPIINMLILGCKDYKVVITLIVLN